MIELDYARRSERRAVDLPVDLMQKRWDDPLGHRVSDISPYGAWVQTSLPLAVGEQVVMSFTPPGAKQPWELFGCVKRQRRGKDSGMAVEFVGLSRAERWKLTRQLRGLPPAHSRRVHVCSRV